MGTAQMPELRECWDVTLSHRVWVVLCGTVVGLKNKGEGEGRQSLHLGMKCREKPVLNEEHH